jgi:hypothetical protein
VTTAYTTGALGPERAYDRSDGVEAAFAEAADAGGLLERSYTIGGHRVRLRAAGAAMIDRLAPALTHLESEPGRADLTINLWDSATFGAPAPPLPDVGEGPHAAGAFFYFSDESVRAGFQLGTSGDPRVMSRYTDAPPPSLSVLDSERDEAWYWVGDAGRIPYWEEATPIRFLLDWWLRDRGVHQLHAGAVGTADGGVLLVGKSGSGKSTSTLACLQSDLLYAGDDYVAVGTGPKPYVHSLYSSGKVEPDHVERLPFLLPAVSNQDQLDQEKAVVYVHEHWPLNITPGFPLLALLAPRVVPGLGESRTVEISRAAGLAALAPSTVFQLHTRGQQVLSSISRLLETTPCFELQLGSDIASIPQAVSSLLETLSERGRPA